MEEAWRVGSVLFMDVTFLAQILHDLGLPLPAWLGMCCHTVLCDRVAWQVTARWDKAAWDEAGECQC